MRRDVCDRKVGKALARNETNDGYRHLQVIVHVASKSMFVRESILKPTRRGLISDPRLPVSKIFHQSPMSSPNLPTTSAGPAQILISNAVAQADDGITLDSLLSTITSLRAEATTLIASTEAVSETVSSLLTDPSLYIDDTPGFKLGNWNSFRRAVKNGDFEGQDEESIAAFNSAIGKWKECEEEVKEAQRPLELAGMRMEGWKEFLNEVKNDLGREEREERERSARGEEKCWESCQACGGGEEEERRRREENIWEEEEEEEEE